jgi:FkbM family methyltransferase
LKHSNFGLTESLVVLDLGSAEALDFPRRLRKLITLIEIDALEDSYREDRGYLKRIALKKAVGGSAGKRVFYKRAWAPCSSLLQADPEVARSFGHEKYVRIVESSEVECETITALLAREGVDRVDWFKTDLEGLDFEVLSSAPDLLSRTLVVQSELRFQPFYLGEPYFHDVVSYLSGKGFELISMKPEVWKYPTANSAVHRDGRLVWADTIFFMSQTHVRKVFQGSAPAAFTKQIVLAKMMGLNNYAEFLYERVMDELPETVKKEIEDYLRPAFNFQNGLSRLVNLVFALPGGGFATSILRRMTLYTLRALTGDKTLKHIGSLY